MLKIKDSVDLKELEKFVFKKEGDSYRYVIKDNINGYQNKDLTINKYGHMYFDLHNNIYGFLVPVIVYDLIKADLVEKVDD